MRPLINADRRVRIRVARHSVEHYSPGKSTGAYVTKVTHSTGGATGVNEPAAFVTENHRLGAQSSRPFSGTR